LLGFSVTLFELKIMGSERKKLDSIVFCFVEYGIVAHEINMEKDLELIKKKISFGRKSKTLFCFVNMQQRIHF
jgi:hypothetical protein